MDFAQVAFMTWGPSVAGAIGCGLAARALFEAWIPFGTPEAMAAALGAAAGCTLSVAAALRTRFARPDLTSFLLSGFAAFIGVTLTQLNFYVAWTPAAAAVSAFAPAIAGTAMASLIVYLPTKLAGRPRLPTTSIWAIAVLGAVAVAVAALSTALFWILSSAWRLGEGTGPMTPLGTGLTWMLGAAAPACIATAVLRGEARREEPARTRPPRNWLLALVALGALAELLFCGMGRIGFPVGAGHLPPTPAMAVFYLTGWIPFAVGIPAILIAFRPAGGRFLAAQPPTNSFTWILIALVLIYVVIFPMLCYLSYMMWIG